MKLVRDNIPNIIKESGKTCEYHVADYDEYKARLYEKMHEELAEFISTPCYEEAADIYEVFSMICQLHDLNMFGVECVAVDKRHTKGGFAGRVILEKVGGNRGSCESER